MSYVVILAVGVAIFLAYEFELRAIEKQLAELKAQQPKRGPHGRFAKR